MTIPNRSLLFLLLSVGLSSAEAGPSSSHTLPELESFVDGFFAEQMVKWHVPGVVFVLVKDGAPMLSKGYGFADLEKKTEVIPEKTVFRVGSLSKLLTATALMQLSERGRIDLDTNVNQYISPIRIDDSYAEPITAASLLTHTAGLDDRYIGIAARSAAEQTPLKQYLAKRLPPRVNPPDDMIAYSNHGFALAGLLVEEISGVSFEDYMDQEIFRPLAMVRTSFRLPDALKDGLATGYSYDNDTFTPAPYDYFNVGPASSLNTTAADMARFMMAQLDGGRYGGSRILSPDSIEEMQRQQFTHHPRLAGRGYGFHERFENGERVIAHAGGLQGFGSYLFLIPRHQLGVFIAYNRVEEKFHEEFVKEFLDRYFRVGTDSRRGGDPDTQSSQRFGDITRFTGSYRSLRYLSRRSFEKLMSLFHEYRVTTDGSTLTVRYPNDFREASQWAEVEPLLFRRVDEDGYLAFRENGRGEITHMFVGTEAYEKLMWYEEPSFQKSLFKFFTPAFMSASILGVIFFLLGFWRGKDRSLGSSYLLAISVSALNLGFLVGGAHFGAGGDAYSYLYGMPPVMMALLVVPLVTVTLSVVLAAATALTWKRGAGSLPGRLYFSLATLIALAFIPFLHYWNLLGFRY
ncbi:MAG: serine hydrolase [Vicinamibacteria bacterium]